MPYVDDEKWNKVLNLLEKYGAKEKAAQWHQKHLKGRADGDCGCHQQGVWAGAGSKRDSDDLALGFGFFIRSVAHGRVVGNTPDWVKDAFNRSLAEEADANGGRDGSGNLHSGIAARD